MGKCPKCQYVRVLSDDHVQDGVCPSCGIAYVKWLAMQQSKQPSFESVPEAVVEYEVTEEVSLLQAAKGLLLDVPENVDVAVFWGRAVVFFLFFAWGWSFIFSGVDWVSINGSFMHNINLPFHEFGHVLFRPFGHFMTLLGGSLFQIMMPLIVMIAFIRQRDNFEASIMLWWAGQSFIDLSPYISDGQDRYLPLISGMGEGAHDWGNLLVMMDAVGNAHLFGRFSFLLGAAIILVSFVWGGYLLYRQKMNMTRF